MQDGLYLNDTWVAEVDAPLTFQGFDLNEPDSRKASFSNTFTLPDSLLLRDLTQNAEQVDAGGVHPYRQLPAYLVAEGEVIFRGVAEFVSFQAGWKVNLLDGLISFFDAIKDKKLSDLDLSRYDHTWSLDSMSSSASATDGITYPAIDYGTLDGAIFAYDSLFPAVYVKTLFGEIAKEAGYRLVGDWLNDPLLARLALPFVGADAIAHDEDWKNDRTARVTVTGSTDYGDSVNHIIPFSVDGAGLSGQWTDGKQDNFKPERNAYVCDTDMRVRVQAYRSFKTTVIVGTVEASLSVEKNGVRIHEETFEGVGLYNQLNVKTDVLQINTEINCKAGDELRVRFMFGGKTLFSKYFVTLVESPDNTWASFIPDPTVQPGDTWPVAKNLPDLSCSDLVLSLAKIMSATYDVDDSRKTVRLIPLDNVVDNIPNAQDWSVNVDESNEPELLVQLDPYGRKNWCRWKEQDEKTNKGYGDGAILCDTVNLPAETELFELPLMACLPSDNILPGYGRPVLIKTRTVRKSGEEVTIDKNDTTARFVLIEPTMPVTVQTKVMSSEGTIQNKSVTLSGCWFGVRPAGLQTGSNAFSLVFSPVSSQQTEVTLLTRYFKALKRILRRPRQLTLSFYLQPADVANMSLYQPVRLQKVRAGSLDLNDGYYYLNKLANYRPGTSCPAMLIAF